MKNTKTMEKTEKKLFASPNAYTPSGTAGTSIAKYQPVTGTDDLNKAIKYNCVTCMKEYESKSLEELRLEDYSENRKGSQLCKSYGSMTQQSTEKTDTNKNVLLGTTSSNQSVFGSTNTTSTPVGLLIPLSSSTPSADKMVFSFNAPGTNMFGHVTAATPAEKKNTFETTTSHTTAFGSTIKALDGNKSTFGTTSLNTGFLMRPKRNISLFGHMTAVTSVESTTSVTTTSHTTAFGSTIKAPDANKSTFGTTSSNTGFLLGPKENKSLFGVSPSSQAIFGSLTSTHEENEVGISKDFTFGRTAGVPLMKKKKSHYLNNTTSDKHFYGCSTTAAPVQNESTSGKISLFDTRNKLDSGFAFGNSVCGFLTSDSKRIFNFGQNLDGSNTATSAETKTLLSINPSTKSVFAETKSIFNTNLTNKSILSKSSFEFIEPKNKNSFDTNNFESASPSDAISNHIKPATPTPKTCSTYFSTNNSDAQSGYFETKDKTQITTMVLPSYFSWTVFEEKLNSALDNKLQNVAKTEAPSRQNKIENSFAVKETNEIEELLAENKNLKADLKELQNKLEQVDRDNRRFRIFVRGLISRESNAATDELLEICARRLETTVQVTDSVKLNYGQAFVFTLGSTAQVSAVIARRASLKNAAIYIEKDYTVEERNRRYQLRMLSKKLNSLDKIKIRLGEFSLFVNDKPFVWLDDAIVAESKKDADFLKELLILVNCSTDVKEKIKAEVRLDKVNKLTRHSKPLSLSDNEDKSRKSNTSTLNSSCSMLLDIEDTPEKTKVYAARNVSLKLPNDENKPQKELRRKSY